ncbi:MAG: mechanosensitive ion channel family protein [Rhodospirillaceae bacterium]
MNEVIRVVELIPDWAAGVGIFILAVATAALVYLTIARVIALATKRRATYLHSVFHRVRRIVGLGLILIAINLAVQLPYFPERVSALTSKFLSVAVILLIGWAATIAVDVASNLYLRQYKNETADSILARKHFTQIRVLRRTIDVLIGIVTIAAALMAFEPVRQFGVSLFASAGAAGLVVGLAARPVLSNLIAGIQLAITQPIRLNDAVIVEGEWGTIEEITSTYVVIKVWDLRRLIVPLSYFMEKPFQNWTRESTQLVGAVYLRVDYAVPVDRIRAKLQEIAQASSLWDKQVVNLQVTDMKDNTVELRMLVSAATSGDAWNLRCEVREKMLTFLQNEYPDSLPRQRVELMDAEYHQRGQRDEDTLEWPRSKILLRGNGA